MFCLPFFLCCNQKNNAIDPNIFVAKPYSSKSVSEKEKFLDSIQIHFKLEPNDSLHRAFLFNLSAEYYYINNLKKSYLLNKKILEYSKKEKDTFSIARANSYLGDCFESSQSDSAYYYFNRAEKLYQSAHNKEKVGNMLFKKAYLLFYEGNYLESQIQDSKALKFLKDTNDYQLLFSAYTILGVNFERLEEYNDALKYYKNADLVLNVLKKEDLDFDKKYNYAVASALNLSNVYVKIKKYNEAIKELESFDLNELREKWPNDYVAVISNLAYAKMKGGNLKGGEEMFFKALKWSKENNNEIAVIYQDINLGEYYLITGNNIKSKEYLKKSIALAKKNKVAFEIKTALRLLVKADPSNSTYYDEQYISISDSLAKLQQKSRDKFARIEYETSVVEDANKILTKKNFYIIIGSLILIFLLIGILIYRYIKSQKRELLFREQQQKAEEEIFELLKQYQIKLSEAKEIEQNRIAKELHDGVMNKLYGVRMQLGILNKSDAIEIKNKRLAHIDTLQEIEQEIRAISHNLHTDVITGSFDFVSLLSNLILQNNEIATTHFSFDCELIIDWESVSSLIKIALYRIVQEALSNVLKYAEAQNCSVIISLDEHGKILLVIQDDGKGFDISNQIEGIGLKNIKERAKNVNAVLVIDSSLGSGTLIEVAFI